MLQKNNYSQDINSSINRDQKKKRVECFAQDRQIYANWQFVPKAGVENKTG